MSCKCNESHSNRGNRYSNGFHVMHKTVLQINLWLMHQRVAMQSCQQLKLAVNRISHQSRVKSTLILKVVEGKLVVVVCVVRVVRVDRVVCVVRVPLSLCWQLLWSAIRDLRRERASGPRVFDPLHWQGKDSIDQPAPFYGFFCPFLLFSPPFFF